VISRVCAEATVTNDLDMYQSPNRKRGVASCNPRVIMGSCSNSTNSDANPIKKIGVAKAACTLVVGVFTKIVDRRASYGPP